MPKTTQKRFRCCYRFYDDLKMGKKIHLCEYETNELAEGLSSLFERKVDVPRIKHGKAQTIDTLISEEALLFAKFLRNEKLCWNPRIAVL